MTPASSPIGDSGFSLLEVLVALAIASLVAMAIGGLFLLTSELRTRTSEAERIEATLVSLQGMESLLGRDLDLHVQDSSSTGFELVAGDQSEASSAETIHVRLVSRDKEPRIEMGAAGGPLNVDLSSFQMSGLEYLTADVAGKVVWTSEDHLPGQALAVRLRLMFGARVWRPLLWIVATPIGGAPAAASS